MIISVIFSVQVYTFSWCRAQAKFTIPCLLFTSILDCEQDFSNEACTNIVDYLKIGWPMLLLPAVNVGFGLLLGWIVTKITSPAEDVRKGESLNFNSP